MQRKTPYVSVHLTEAARDEIRTAALGLTSSAGRRISMSDVATVAIRVAMEHRDEMLRELRNEA